MKRLILSSTILSVMLAGSTLLAQDMDDLKPAAPAEPAVEQKPVIDEAQQTEDMWFYLQELRRYDDPFVMIRRKAQRKAEQRRLRLAAQKWFGYSAGRPTANPTPYTGVHSPMWVGNGLDPFQWVGAGYTTVAVRVDQVKTKR